MNIEHRSEQIELFGREVYWAAKSISDSTGCEIDTALKCLEVGSTNMLADALFDVGYALKEGVIDIAVSGGEMLDVNLTGTIGTITD